MTMQPRLWAKRLFFAATLAISLPLALMAHEPAVESGRVDTTMSLLPPGIWSDIPTAGAMQLPPELRGLELSTAQQDQLFALMRARAPKEQEQFDAALHALDALRQSPAQPAFDAARAQQLAQRYGQSLARVVLMQAEFDARVRALLTAEQGRQLDELLRPAEPKEARLKG